MSQLALLALVAAGLEVGPPPPPPTADQAVEIWLSQTDGLRFGDNIRVYVRTEDDGHIVILHADPEGRVRVLFPLDPFSDDFIRGGGEYEIRDRNDDDAIETVEAEGVGTVYVAYSRDPFRYGEFVRDDHWDFRALGEIEVVGDAERELTEIAQRMASGAVFEYDLEEYVQNPIAVYAGRTYRRYGVFYDRDRVYHSRVSFGFNVNFGHSHHNHYGRFYRGPVFYYSYYDPFYYDPYWDDPFYWSYHRHGSWYDPFYYDRYYYGYGRYAYGGWYYPWGSYYYPVYASDGGRVNRTYVIRGGATGVPNGGRTVAGYRDRRVIAAPGTLARAPERRVVASAEPRRADGRGVPTRRVSSTDRRNPTGVTADVTRRTTPTQRVTTTTTTRRTAEPFRVSDRRDTSDRSGTSTRRATGTSRVTTGGRDTAPTRRQTGAVRVSGDRTTAPTRRSGTTTPQNRSSDRGVTRPPASERVYRVAPRVTSRRQPEARTEQPPRTESGRGVVPTSRRGGTAPTPTVDRSSRSGSSVTPSRGLSPSRRVDTPSSSRSSTRATTSTRTQMRAPSRSPSRSVAPGSSRRGSSASPRVPSRSSSSARSGRSSGSSASQPTRRSGSSASSSRSRSGSTASRSSTTTRRRRGGS